MNSFESSEDFTCSRVSDELIGFKLKEIKHITVIIYDDSTKPLPGIMYFFATDEH